MASREMHVAKVRTQGRGGANGRTAIIVASISAVAAILALLLNYILTERLRTQMQAQTLALERIKTEVSVAAQRTADAAVKIDDARLDFERTRALVDDRFESRKLNIESKKNRTEEVKLTPDFAKLSNDLRPNVHILCNGRYVRKDYLKLNCSFKNNGVHRVRLIPKQFLMLDRLSQREIVNAISKTDNADQNTLLSGGSGSNTYDLILAEPGEKAEQPIVSIRFLAQTDQQAIKMTERLAGGYISEGELKELSEQGYTQNLLF